MSTSKEGKGRESPLTVGRAGRAELLRAKFHSQGKGKGLDLGQNGGRLERGGGEPRARGDGTKKLFGRGEWDSESRCLQKKKESTENGRGLKETVGGGAPMQGARGVSPGK